MPTYEYRCPDGHDFERFFRKISDAPAEVACSVCGKIAERRMSAGAGLVFKGSGFYLTDYGKNAHRKSGDASSGGSEAAGDSKGESKGESTGESKGESKSESASGGESKPAEKKGSEGAAPKSEAKASESKPASPAASTSKAKSDS